MGPRQWQWQFSAQMQRYAGWHGARKGKRGILGGDGRLSFEDLTVSPVSANREGFKGGCSSVSPPPPPILLLKDYCTAVLNIHRGQFDVELTDEQREIYRTYRQRLEHFALDSSQPTDSQPPQLCLITRRLQRLSAHPRQHAVCCRCTTKAPQRHHNHPLLV